MFASSLNAPLNIFQLFERYLCLKCGFSDDSVYVWLMLIYYYISMPCWCKPLIPNARTDAHGFTNVKIAESVTGTHWMAFLFWNWSQNYCFTSFCGVLSLEKVEIMWEKIIKYEAKSFFFPDPWWWDFIIQRDQGRVRKIHNHFFKN